MSYQDYLNSQHWKDLKVAKSKATKKRCGICGDDTRVELHHLFYRKILTDAKLNDLRWLCRICHQTAHDLINSGRLKFPKPDNHNSCYALTKIEVKRARGILKKNMFSNAM